MPIRFARHLMIGLAALALLDCRSDPVGTLFPCTTEVTITATAGTTPRISWSPGCGVARLTVFTPPSLGAPYTAWWDIATLGANIGPSVQYGVMPPGATAIVAAQPLLAGRSYSVIVFDANGHGMGGAQLNP